MHVNPIAYAEAKDHAGARTYLTLMPTTDPGRFVLGETPNEHMAPTTVAVIDVDTLRHLLMFAEEITFARQTPAQVEVTTFTVEQDADNAGAYAGKCTGCGETASGTAGEVAAAGLRHMVNGCNASAAGGEDMSGPAQDSAADQLADSDSLS